MRGETEQRGSLIQIDWPRTDHDDKPGWGINAGMTKQRRFRGVYVAVERKGIQVRIVQCPTRDSNDVNNACIELLKNEPWTVNQQSQSTIATVTNWQSMKSQTTISYRWTNTEVQKTVEGSSSWPERGCYRPESLDRIQMIQDISSTRDNRTIKGHCSKQCSQ